jgi:DNA sulfur modification protein DndD
MQLKSLTLENIRIFKGVHTLDFTPVHNSKKHKPIILIGGNNGAGKTTMFESILLCLYGQNSPGSLMGKGKYEQYIAQMTARNKKTEDPFNPAIEVVFEFSHSGTTHIYSVRRAWINHPEFSETLTVKRDGEILSDMEVDQWQDLLNELIPPRFARLFLFDGEKIQNLVEDKTDNLFLRDSFKSLLGLDIVERLKADLGIYLTRYLKSKEISHIPQNLEELESEVKEIESKKDHYLQDRAQVQSRYDQISSEIEGQEQIVASEGGSFARKREDLKNQKNQLDHQITTIEGGIRELCAGLFPFAITPKYCALLKQHLIEEDTIQARKRSEDLIRSSVEELNKIIQSAAFWSDLSLPSAQKDKVRTKLSTLLDEQFMMGNKSTKSILIHHLSQYEYTRLLQWIDDSITTVPKKMNDLSIQLEDLTAKRRKVAEMINKAPSDDIIAPLIQKLNELSKSLGELSEKLRIADENIRNLDVQLKELERQKIKLDEELQGVKGGSKKMQLAQQVTIILNEYMKELQHQKVSQLSDNILSCFTRLIRKEDYVKDIVIDENYAITLYEPDGHAIPKELLSAGEKEIFAVSLLWGLTLTSGRQLPFIIDTPLGRLDSEHRGNLIMDFFQHAGDQMIIFSTDTEIDKEYFRVLQPHIARAYHLDYSKKDRMTTISPGYFWKSKPMETES